MTTFNAAKLTQRDRQLAALLASGMTDEAAAQKIGVSRSTVTRTKAKAGFRELVSAIRDEAAERLVAVLGSIAVEAVVALRGLIASPSPTVRLGAVRANLEFFLRGREHTELTRRIADLEHADDDSLPPDAPGAAAGVAPGGATGPADAGTPPGGPGPGTAECRPVAGNAPPQPSAAHDGGVLPPVG